MNVADDFHDAQIRVEQIDDEIEKHRRAIQHGDLSDEEWDSAVGRIEYLRKKKNAIESYWDERSQTGVTFE